MTWSAGLDDDDFHFDDILSNAYPFSNSLDHGYVNRYSGLPTSVLPDLPYEYSFGHPQKHISSDNHFVPSRHIGSYPPTQPRSLPENSYQKAIRHRDPASYPTAWNAAPIYNLNQSMSYNTTHMTREHSHGSTQNTNDTALSGSSIDSDYKSTITSGPQSSHAGNSSYSTLSNDSGRTMQAEASHYHYSSPSRSAKQLHSTVMRTPVVDSNNIRSSVPAMEINSTNASLYCQHPDCFSQEGVPKRRFSRKADVSRHYNSAHNPEFLDCPRKNCTRKGSRGFTRQDHLTEHLRGYHSMEIPKRGVGDENDRHGKRR